MIEVHAAAPATVSADAVLRPADAHLGPHGADALALDAAAGPDFPALRRVRDPLRRGAAVVTGGAGLAAGFVLHCVVQDAEITADRVVLRQALTAAWLQAEAWGLPHVVAPLRGWGNELGTEELVAMVLETWTAARGPAGRRLTFATEDAAVAARVGDLLAQAGR